MADLHINQSRGWETQWNEEEDKILKEYYPIYGWERVIELLPERNKSGIQQRAFKLGIKKLNYNKNYFNVIDTSEKAYWLGFMYADGYVTTNNRWGIELCSRDKEHIEKFTKALESNIKIKTRKRICFGKEVEQSGFIINNSTMYHDLVNKGVVPNKTYNLNFPNEDILPVDFYPDFIRGLFDGDGTYVINDFISTHNEKDYNCNSIEISMVCKCKDFILSLQQIIQEQLSINASFYHCKANDLYYFRLHSKDRCLKFINYLYYPDVSIFLQRKFDKAHEIKLYCLT